MKIKLLILFLLGFELQSAYGIVAGFTASKTVGCAPLVVNFTDLSTPSLGNPITFWSYDFGDGGSATIPDPKYTFTKAGTWKVKLTVSDGSSSSTFSMFIKVLKSPVADFSAGKTGYCPGETVYFVNKTVEGDTTIRTSNWDFGDGSILASKTDVSKTYSLAGLYTIKLTVRDHQGCQDIMTKTQYITVDAGPKADFTFVSKYTCASPRKVNFTNKSSGNSASFKWDMGNGNTYTDPNPVDFYLSEGIYNVKLTALTTNGCSDTRTIPVVVIFDPLTADFNTDKYIGCIPFDPRFKNATLPSGATVDYAWDFGDGTRSTAENPPKLYNKTGTYQVKFKVTGVGCSDSITKTITVSDKPRTTLSMSDSIECDGVMKVVLRSPSPDNIISRTWYIDGRNIQTSADSLVYLFGKPDPQKPTRRPGIYKAYVSLQDFAGCEQYVQYPDIVVQYLKSGFEYFAFGGCVPFQPKLKDTSICAVPSRLSYIWNDGNGNTYTTRPPALPPIVYPKIGTYDLSLIIKDTFGCESEEILAVKVGKKIKPDFRIGKKVICNNEDVTLYNTMPDSLKSQVYTYKWMLLSKDGTDRDSFRCRLREFPALLTPKLITEHNECRDTLIKEDSMTLNPPLADFKVQFDTCYVSTARLIHNSRLATSFKWILPDGSVSTDTTLIRRITEPKTKYAVIAYNKNYGCIDTNKQEIDPPKNMSEMSAILHPNHKCTPQGYILSNNKIVMPSRTHWDFGDGDTTNIIDPYEWMNPATGETDTFLHLFKAPGIYTIRHTGWDRSGCIYTSSATVTVVGPDPASSVWPLKGCVPLKINLVDSFVPDIPAKIVKKYWVIQDADSSIIVPNKDTTHEYIITQMPRNGDTIIHAEFFVEDENGCKSSRVFKIRPSGPRARIDVGNKLKCDVMEFNFEMVVDSNSTYLPATVEWKMGDGNIITDSKFSYVYEKAGYYFIKAKLTDALGCTFSDEIDVAASQPELFARFGMDNRHAVCPPLITQFTESCVVDPNNQVTQYLWDFGDGTTSTMQNPGKIYTVPGTYDVSLTIKNKYGCTNTRLWKNAIYVGGPNGAYKLESVTGCHPLTVKFEIKNDSNTLVEWDFGNGKTSLSNQVEHTYMQPGIYYPKILLKDSGGCNVVLIPKDSVYVHNSPSADFGNLTNCLDDSIVFFNSSLSNIPGNDTITSRWILGGDTFKTRDFKHKFAAKGQYQVSLIVENKFFCSDTVGHMLRVTKPSARFSAPNTRLCLGDSLRLKDESPKDSGPYTTKWFVDKTEVDLLNYTPDTGHHTIDLVITDTLNCPDTFSLATRIRVADTLPPAGIELLSVSAVTDHLFELRYPKTNDVDFDHYNFYHLQGTDWVPAGRMFRADSLMVRIPDLGVKKSQCFRITQSNYCKSESDLATNPEHCSIHTIATPGINKNILDWNAYVGWPVTRYTIARQNIQYPEMFDSIGTVDGNLLTFADTTVLCNTHHAYHVIAYGAAESMISRSDSARAKAIWVNMLPAPVIDYVTVDQDTSIIVKWQLNTDYTRSTYKNLLLYKSYDFGTQVKAFKPFGSEYNDRRVSVDRNRYDFYTRVTDECGDTSSASPINNNILVQSLSDGTFDPPEFRWNQYRKWPGGVKYYEVQRLNKDNMFETIHTTSDTSYKDIYAIDLCMKQYRYRIIATEQTLNGQDIQDKSTSNEIRIRPKSSLYVPNAFTPDQNGLNEVFAPKGQYIYNYQLEIYNRWGERVFISNECLAGWNGMYKDEIAGEGIYYYKLDAFGNDGKVYSYKGLLTLLR